MAQLPTETPPECSSPPCYAHEVDPAYMGFVPAPVRPATPGAEPGSGIEDDGQAEPDSDAEVNQ